MINPIIQDIFSTGYIADESGRPHKVESSIDLNEGLFIQQYIKKYSLSRTLEIGCAMGISSLFICDALKSLDTNVKHIILDPFQASQWHNIGVSALKRAGFNFFDLIEQRSEFALPKLLEQNTEIDLAFIDGWHTFDHTLLDFFYLNRMLKVGGILLIDDVRMPAINKVVRYISNYPSLLYVGTVNVDTSKQSNATSLRLKLKEYGKTILRPIAHLVGKEKATDFFDDSVLRSDNSLGLKGTMVAFQKVAEDDRNWNWYTRF